jgi:hypothetical protein
MSEERRFSREFKLAALARMEAGENVSALAAFDDLEIGHPVRERAFSGLREQPLELGYQFRKGFRQPHQRSPAPRFAAQPRTAFTPNVF